MHKNSNHLRIHHKQEESSAKGKREREKKDFWGNQKTILISTYSKRKSKEGMEMSNETTLMCNKDISKGIH